MLVDFFKKLISNKTDRDKSDLEKKISDAEKRISETSGLVKKQI